MEEEERFCMHKGGNTKSLRFYEWVSEGGNIQLDEHTKK